MKGRAARIRNRQGRLTPVAITLHPPDCAGFPDAAPGGAAVITQVVNPGVGEGSRETADFSRTAAHFPRLAGGSARRLPIPPGSISPKGGGYEQRPGASETGPEPGGWAEDRILLQPAVLFFVQRRLLKETHKINMTSAMRPIREPLTERSGCPLEPSAMPNDPTPFVPRPSVWTAAEFPT